MSEKKISDLIEMVKTYNPNEIEIINKAYDFAEQLHRGQTRQSSEPYIIHPLNVAYILAEMHADKDTVCAGLLHDTLEDTEITKEIIIEEFNAEVAKLVDRVTKLSKINFSSKQEQNMANTRKIITGITEDVRIIIIKLADRLHNMRTLQFKSEFKQKENALETMEIFVPLAYYIGAYRIKQMLNDKNIPNEIKVRTKNIYGIYKRLSEGHKLSDIHDLFALKIMVDEVENCYRTLYYIHKEYHPINDKFKDYICNPKTNMYRSLHTTVFGPDDKLVQTQIRTFDMDKVASFGLPIYWDIEKGKARDVMQKELKNKYQFFKSLTEINAMFGDNQEFVSQIKNELFSDKIYVYTTKGDIIELPKGSTPIDFAYQIHTDIGNTMVAAIVNDEYVPIDYQLKNKDRVKIVTDELSFGPREDWIDKAQTTHAKRKIKEFNKK